MKKRLEIDFNKGKIKYNDNCIDFNIVRRSKKNVIIKFLSYNLISISTPKVVSKSFIEEVIAKNIDNIIKENNRQKDKNNLESVYILGKKYKVIISNNIGDEKIIKKDDNIIINETSTNKAREALYQYYFQLTKKLIEEKVRFYVKMMDVSINKIYIKDVKSIWGSCSGKNNLTFNYKLSMCSIEAIDYIVVHELAHTKYRDHSKDFWDYVAQYIPNWKEIRKSMKSINYDII